MSLVPSKWSVLYILFYWFCESYQSTSMWLFLTMASLSSQTHVARYCNPMLSLTDSAGCLQPSHITLINAAWLHKRLSAHYVCLAWQQRAPDLLLTVLILDVTLWINSPLHSRVPNATPPLRRVYSMSKFHMDGMGVGNLIISPKLRINLPAKHYSNQKHNLLNVCIHQPCHLC